MADNIFNRVQAYKGTHVQIIFMTWDSRTALNMEAALIELIEQTHPDLYLKLHDSRDKGGRGFGHKEHGYQTGYLDYLVLYPPEDDRVEKDMKTTLLALDGLDLSATDTQNIL